MAKRIFGAELCTLFVGVTDVPIRRTRMRAAIIERGLKDVIVTGSKVTFAAAFERLYGESLIQKAAA